MEGPFFSALVRSPPSPNKLLPLNLCLKALLGMLLASVRACGDAPIYSFSACEAEESGRSVVVEFKSFSSSASLDEVVKS